MNNESDYFVVRTKALPTVLKKVAEVKSILESEKGISIAEATEKAGISRSSFYKYKDDIFPFYDSSKGKTVTLVIEMRDELGYLSKICSKISEYRANILTIHQSIPINSIVTLTVSIEVREDTSDINTMIHEIESWSNIQYVKILSQENTPG
ncbi:ACT domain-containing protein [Oribacterium sp. WCC10]|uniref:ACT domain-containing protein n=1 Tax=Oribacterium sp. WCC10 TaxID=1855343 RepID=UPI0008EC47B3|nr:ACT domain-containing protein [Oribacterium sp. WCC10]SFG50592.1 chorismate mutase [Oribacterium sp. WCC10]